MHALREVKQRLKKENNELKRENQSLTVAMNESNERANLAKLALAKCSGTAAELRLQNEVR